MGQTVVEKIAQNHRTPSAKPGNNRPVRAGEFVSLRPDHVMTHDNTAAVIKKFEALGAPGIDDPRQPVFTLDHDIQNRSRANLEKYQTIQAFAGAHGVDFYPAGTGIGHQVLVENGYVRPGALIVASDSHANMHGALGALGTPVVRTDAAVIWATGEFWWVVPRTIELVLSHALRPGVSGKDLIIALAGAYPSQVLNAVVEVTGPGVATLSMDTRLTIANMSTEWGALAAWFPVDEITLAFLEARREILAGKGLDRISKSALAAWRQSPIRPDADAVYAGRIEVDLSRISPHIAGPDTVQAVQPLGAVQAERRPIHKAYLLSCVNSRLEDLRAGARVLAGKPVADGVTLYVAAASQEVQQAAELDGTWKTLIESGAKILPPGCGPCIGLGQGLLEAGETGISATNRNFKGRMGSRDAQCYLASPEVVAASALAGYICAPADWSNEPIESAYRALESSKTAEGKETVEIVDGFPTELQGRWALVPADNLNTDGIFGKDYMYREDTTPQMMAQVAMANYDPDFGRKVNAGAILVGGYNFGTGSSREQAVTALQHKGIALVIAGSFSQTYLRNAFNNGFLCIECAPLVDHLRAAFVDGAVKPPRTIVSDAPDADADMLTVRFATATLVWRGQSFGFTPIGPVPQSLVAAGGVENLARKQLGLAV